MTKLSQLRESKGTPGGGRFAPGVHAEADTVSLGSPPVAFDWTGGEPYSHVDLVLMSVDRSWEDGRVSFDEVYADIATELTSRGIAVPQKSQIAAHPFIGEVIGNTWSESDPDVVPPDDQWSEPGTLTWKGARISPAESRQWEAADVLEPSVARALADAGMTPEDAKTTFRSYDDEGRSSYGTYESVGRVVMFNELTAAEAVAFVAAEKKAEQEREDT